MIGNIAHQWRQPLNALRLVLSNLRDASRFGELDAEGVEQAVADGNRLVQKMSSTINDFRDFFRPEKERHAFSALAQIRETVGLLDASFRNDGIALEIEAPADVVLFGYSNEYSQVLLNLLANAKQAITALKIAAGRVSVRLEVRGGLGCLTVRDNGEASPGDPRQDLRALFLHEGERQRDRPLHVAPDRGAEPRGAPHGEERGRRRGDDGALRAGLKSGFAPWQGVARESNRLALERPPRPRSPIPGVVRGHTHLLDAAHEPGAVGAEALLRCAVFEERRERHVPREGRPRPPPL